MHDVLGEIVLAVGDEDLLAADPVVVAVLHGAGPERARSEPACGSVRFMVPVHCPLIIFGSSWAAVPVVAARLECFGGAATQQRTYREGDVGAKSYLLDRRRQHQRCTLAAVCAVGASAASSRPRQSADRRARNSLASARAPSLKARAGAIADAIDRRQHVRRQARGFLEHPFGSGTRDARCHFCTARGTASTRRSSCCGRRCGRWCWVSRCPARCRRSSRAARCGGRSAITGRATLAKASFFGVISSSCSYASSALAKSLFARGADFTAAMVFMVASTNLVVELGIVLWLLIGWQFALAEFVGGAIMIVLLGLIVPRVIPAVLARRSPRRARPDRRRAATGGRDDAAEPSDQPLSRAAAQPAPAGATPPATRSATSTMLRKELLIGFLDRRLPRGAGTDRVLASLFLTGHGFWSSLENVVLGPFLAIISFVCSVGNVPLAAALWHGGISFGGVVSFVFADLITLPLLAIYRKYFGTAITLRLLATFWATMSVAGLAVEYLFRGVGIPEPARPMHDRAHRISAGTTPPS